MEALIVHWPKPIRNALSVSASHGWTFFGPLNVFRTTTGPHTTTWGPKGHLADKHHPNCLTRPLSDTSFETLVDRILIVSRFDAMCLIRVKVVWYWYEIPLLILFGCHLDSSKFCIPVNIPHWRRHLLLASFSS